MAVLFLLVGLAMLVGGAELLVRGGGAVALALRVPALIVGLTVVAFGTSAPELAVSVSAAWSGSTEAALANVTGSNIANILLVLGIAALVRPLLVDRALIKREIPALLVLQLIVPVLCLDEVITWYEGLLLLALGLGYNGLLVYNAMQDRDAALAADGPSEKLPISRWVMHIAFVLGGVIILVIGAQIFVTNAFVMAQWLGFSDRFIGLTVIALGTSAPEIVTGAVSAARGEVDLAVGNSIGSNILNISMVLALTALVHPIDFRDAASWIDLVVANAATLLLVVLVLAAGKLGRVAGALMIASYIAYIVLSQG